MNSYEKFKVVASLVFELQRKKTDGGGIENNPPCSARVKLCRFPIWAVSDVAEHETQQ